MELQHTLRGPGAKVVPRCLLGNYSERIISEFLLWGSVGIFLEAAGILPVKVLKQRLKALCFHFRYSIKDKIPALEKKLD